MRVPQWLSLLVAAWVILFGAYRLKLAFDPHTDERRAEGKKGIFAMKRRTQGLLGFIYVLLGAALIATSFGWNPFEGVITPDEPKTAPAPVKGAPRAIDVQRNQPGSGSH
jgi:hypothetical protein